jgi:hypothetical protein
MHRPNPRAVVLIGVCFLIVSTATTVFSSQPTPPPNCNPICPSPTPNLSPPPATCPLCPSTPLPTAPPIDEGNIPVVITYGDGTEARVQITLGIMEPVGIPPNQPVTVTLYLASGIPGSPVQVGLFDGGQISPAVPAVDLANPRPVPTPPGGGITVDPTLAAPILVLADGSVRFNFQSGLTLGLYRTLVTIGPKQYLLQLYAVRPRSNASPSPLPTVAPNPTVHVPPTPAPPPI